MSYSRCITVHSTQPVYSKLYVKLYRYVTVSLHLYVFNFNFMNR